MNDTAQQADQEHKQTCMDLEKATQCIIQALQHEVEKNQESLKLIRRLEEKEAETSQNLSELMSSNKRLQVKINKLQKQVGETQDSSNEDAEQECVDEKEEQIRELKLKIEDLQKQLDKKDHSLSHARQNVTILKTALRDLHQQLKISRRKQYVCEWTHTGEEQHKQAESDSSAVQSEQRVTAEEFQIGPESVVSSDTLSLIKQETTVDEYEDCTVLDKAALSAAGVKPDQILSVLSLEEPPFVPESETEQHTPGKGAPEHHVCSECGKSYRSVLEAKECPHEEERLFPCTHCPKRFPTASSLKKHQRTHSGKRPFVCVLCGKSFTQGVHLKQHKRIHTGERPYACGHCGKTFTRNCDRTRHQFIHTRDRPFSCTHCGTKVVVKNYESGAVKDCAQCGYPMKTDYPRAHKEPKLVRKPRKKEEKPYHCVLCGKGFIFEGSFTRHQLAHLGGKTSTT